MHQQRPRTPTHSATDDVAIGFAGGVLASIALMVAVALMRAMAAAWGVDTAITACALPALVIIFLALAAAREEVR